MVTRFVTSPHLAPPRPGEVKSHLAPRPLPKGGEGDMRIGGGLETVTSPRIGGEVNP